ncbi:MAG: LCP family protein [Clostridiales Family XIII bacterium]|nr:LCP family protein [Clostridiales Family XIII bacterium]
MIEKIKFKKTPRASDAGGTAKSSVSNGAGAKSNSKATVFWIPFLAAFILLSIVLVPVMGAILEYRPLAAVSEEGEDGEEKELVILEEDFTDYFIPSNSPFYAAFKDKKRVNCMLLGVTRENLTDTIMLVSFDLEARHVDVISIPRDTYYHREGYNDDAQNKINAAYRKDPLNSAKAVSEILLGMPINYYAVVEYDGVERIVDAIGGVPVDVPKGFDYEDRWAKPPLIIHLKPGLQTLNGADAVKFLRYRKGYPDQDIGRIGAQQAFIKAALKQALQSDLSKLAATIRENVTSDMPMSKMLYLAQKAMGMSPESISTYVLPHKSAYFLYPDTIKIEEMIREIYSVRPEPITPDGVSGEEDAEGDAGAGEKPEKEAAE